MGLERGYISFFVVLAFTLSVLMVGCAGNSLASAQSSIAAPDAGNATNDISIPDSGYSPSALTEAPSAVPPSNVTAPYTYTVISEKYVSGNLIIYYPQLKDLDGIGLGKDAQRSLNIALFGDALLSTTPYGNGNNLTATITYRITYQKSYIMSVLYSGTGKMDGDENSIDFRYATTVDVGAVQQLYLSDIFDISDQFTQTYNKYGKQDVPEVLGYSFEDCQTQPLDGISTFYFDENSLVILFMMPDSVFYPVMIPMSEIIQDVKFPYIGAAFPYQDSF